MTSSANLDDVTVLVIGRPSEHRTRRMAWIARRGTRNRPARGG